MPQQVYAANEVMPTPADVEKILKAKLSYEAAQNTPNKDQWNKEHFTLTPWGISYTLSKKSYEKSTATAKARGWKEPKQKTDVALKYFIIAVALGWDELIDQLKRTLSIWGYTSADMRQYATQVWNTPTNAQKIADMCAQITIDELVEQVENSTKSNLIEAVEKHDTLNSKLFNKEEVLKSTVRDKLLEIVDTFLADLKEQEVKIKVDDILLIGSNASYNYTKDSDIDLHILANTKAVNYPADLGAALYSAYRSVFNKQLDIKICGIPLEIFVEIEDSPRVSNGVYSVNKNKWIKKPIHEDIPEYDKDALDHLVEKWEAKYKKLVDEIKADKLTDEKKVVKLLEEIYDKLRKKGISKGEYSIENLAFKELRNKGYLDKLKDYRNKLLSKRLSLEERLDRQTRADIYNQLTKAAHTQPIIQDNGMFFIYNLKASEVDETLSAIRRLPFVIEAQANESGKYDFSNTLELAMNKMPKKYYNIRGKIAY